MPLVYQHYINPETKIAVWHINEDAAFFLKKVPAKQQITHPQKQLQHLAGRYLLIELYEDFPSDLIKIADTKKPFLENEAYHFSISHCGHYAAAIVSKENRVGADIEIISQKAEILKNKFLSAEEQKIIEKMLKAQYPLLKNEMYTLAWGIKESIFKWYGLGALDFRDHMHINSLHIHLTEFKAECSFLKNTFEQLEVHGRMLHDNILTWTVS